MKPGFQRFIVVSAVAVVAISASGCSSTPTVKYKNFSSTTSSPDLEGFSKFSLQASAIRVKVSHPNPADIPDGTIKANATYAIESIPVSYALARYGIRDSGSDWWVKTEVKVKPRENSELIESLQVEVFDNREQTIKDLGSAGATLLAFAPEPDKPSDSTNQSFVFDLSHAIAKENRGGFTIHAMKPQPSNGKYKDWTLQLSVSELPRDAIAQNIFEPSEHASVFFHSACRDAVATLKNDKGKIMAQRAVRIADANFIQTIALPKKGTIAFMSECGVSVTSESKQTTKESAALNEIIKQVKGIVDAGKSDK